MKYRPDTHRRRSMRLKEYDYSNDGIYFVTVIVQDRQCLLGEVVRNEVSLSVSGKVVQRCWQKIPNHFPSAQPDQYVIMPNHFHGILILQQSLVPGTISCKGFIHETQTRKGLINQTPTKDIPSGWPLMGDPRVTLGKVIRAFKARCAKYIHDEGYAGFHWQRDYYDHIIRDGRDLDRIRQYILDNPANWSRDENFSTNVTMDTLHVDWSPLD